MVEVIRIRSKHAPADSSEWSVADMLEYLSGKIRSGEMDARRAVVIIEVSPGVIESTQAGSKLFEAIGMIEICKAAIIGGAQSRSSAEGRRHYGAGCRTRVRAVPPLGVRWDAGRSPSHPRWTRRRAARKRLSDRAALSEHHRGGTGLHGLGTKAFERTYKLSELDLLAMTVEALGR